MTKHWYRSLVTVMCLVTPAFAQTPARPPRPGEVASDPIHCWWKSDRTAIRVGERFVLVLTCGVIEAGSTTVVAATNQLEPGALSITPFEVVSGTRREDVVVPPWRYFQFEYSVRLLNDGFFGQDINIPGVTVTYNLQAPGGGTQGRDQSYLLPALPMRVLSLVPRGATDIRDASDQTFAIVEARRFRSSIATVVAAVCFAFASVLGIAGIVRVASRYRGRRTAAVRPLSQASVLRACLRALGEVKEDAARGGWTPELARRALAALRVAAAVGIGRKVMQDFVPDGSTRREGQVVARKGLLRRKRALLSAPTTSMAVAPRDGNGRQPAALGPIARALDVFTATSYGRNGRVDALALDEALADGVQAVRRLRVTALWPMRTVGGFFGRPAGARPATTSVVRSITEP